MAENNYCLKNIIGLTNKDCDCFGEVLEDYSVSSTGLYLDTYISPHIELEYGCDALNTLEYIEHAKKRSENFDKAPKQNDAYLQLKDAWRNCRILTNKNVIEAIKYTQAFEDGLIDESKLDSLNIETDSMLEAMVNLKKLIK